MEEYFAADRLLELTIGSVVQILLESGQGNLNVNLVGFNKNKSVVTTLPLSRYLSANNHRDLFTEGRLLEMKTIHDGKIVAFETYYQGMYEDQLLVCSFPELIETRRLRRDTRFPCTISCDIRQGQNEAYGVIVDISYGGCQLNVSRNDNFDFIEKAFKNGTVVDVQVFFPVEDKSEIIAGRVKSVTCQIDGACRVGLSFQEEYDCIRMYLESQQLDSVASFFQ